MVTGSVASGGAAYFEKCGWVLQVKKRLSLFCNLCHCSHIISWHYVCFFSQLMIRFLVGWFLVCGTLLHFLHRQLPIMLFDCH